MHDLNYDFRRKKKICKSRLSFLSSASRMPKNMGEDSHGYIILVSKHCSSTQTEKETVRSANDAQERKRKILIRGENQVLMCKSFSFSLQTCVCESACDY